MRGAVLGLSLFVPVVLACGGGGGSSPSSGPAAPVGAIPVSGTLCEAAELAWATCSLADGGAASVCSDGPLDINGGAVTLRLSRPGETDLALSNGATYFHEVFELTERTRWDGPQGPPPEVRVGLAYTVGEGALEYVEQEGSTRRVSVRRYAEGVSPTEWECSLHAGSLQPLIEAFGAVE